MVGREEAVRAREVMGGGGRWRRCRARRVCVHACIAPRRAVTPPPRTGPCGGRRALLPGTRTHRAAREGGGGRAAVASLRKSWTGQAPRQLCVGRAALSRAMHARCCQSSAGYARAACGRWREEGAQEGRSCARVQAGAADRGLNETHRPCPRPARLLCGNAQRTFGLVSHKILHGYR